ncbi:MAG: C40 family peptidase [Ramlibacter sp.]
MIDISDAWVADLAAHAEACYPAECCGLVVRSGDQVAYRPCANVAQRGQSEFEIDPRDWAAAEDSGEILAVCHSHPDESANPSMADRVMCERSGLPWIIIGWPSQVVKRADPTGWSAPLVGREFHHGVLDCYTLIQDYYRTELGLTLPDFARVDGWWERGQNLYRENFAAAGFTEVNDLPQVHDVILMQVRSDVENHAAVVLAGGQILHHLHGRLSCRDVYGGYWQRVTRTVLRHNSLLAGASA